jgi:Pyruvate/2-oxoacid:ferredoxin oxidoreductase gamma subunit
MRITNYKSNQTLVESNTFTALLSYGVPQVVVMHDSSELKGTILINNKRYSNTTSKHRNQYVNSLDTKQYNLVPATPAEIQEITGLETR